MANSQARPEIFRGYIPELNAIRAIGIVIVVLFHAWPTRNFWEPMRLGWMAMDSFFVLSGFLITGILLDSRGKANFFRSFYINRTLRIFPVYYLVLVLVTLTILAMHRPYVEMTQSWGSPAWFFAYLGNFPAAIHNSFPIMPYSPMWSLQIEEQFYLLFPLLVYWTSKEDLSRILWTLVFVSLAARIAFYFWSPTNVIAPYVLLPLRMDGIALGALIAIRFRQGPWEISRWQLSAATVALLGSTAIASYFTGADFNDSAFVRTFGFALSSFGSALLVLWLIFFRGSRITAPLRIGPIQYLAKLSYPIYLIHMPIRFVLTSRTGLRLTGPLGSKPAGMSFLVCVLSVIFGSLSLHYLETPMLRLRGRFNKPKAPVHAPIAEPLTAMSKNAVPSETT